MRQTGSDTDRSPLSESESERERERERERDRQTDRHIKATNLFAQDDASHPPVLGTDRQTDGQADR